MPFSTHPRGYINGVTVDGAPIIDNRNGQGKVFWVDSTRGSNDNPGTFTKPFASLGLAIFKANSTDTGVKIYVAPSHTEEFGVVIIGRNVQIIGLGRGLNRPTINFSAATNSEIRIINDNVTISNMRFICNVASHVEMIDVQAKNTIIDNCYFGSGTHASGYFIRIGTSNNDSDGTQVINCKIFDGVGTSDSGIKLFKSQDDIEISNCDIEGGFSQGAIHAVTLETFNNLVISDCILKNNSSGDYALLLQDATDNGIARNLSLWTDAYATTIDPAGLYCTECYSLQSTQKNARLNPVIET